MGTPEISPTARQNATAHNHKQIPKIISYQGILTDGAGVDVPDASLTVTFKLCTIAAGGASLWSETQSVSRFVSFVIDMERPIVYISRNDHTA